jgi:hypothetical protein
MQRSPRADVFEVENQTRGPADRGRSSDLARCDENVLFRI